MRQVLNIIIISLIGSTLLAQSQHPHCGYYPDSEGHEEHTNRLLHHVRTLAEMGGSIGARDVEYVPISFHIGRRSDGSGGVSISRVLDQLCELNEDFAPYDIQFFLAETDGIHEINNTTFYETHSGTANFMNQRRNSNAMNIYIPETANITNEGQGEVLAYYSPSRDWIVVGRNYIQENDATLTHEIGHFFSLEHTFYGYETESHNVENVNAPVNSPGGIPTERANGSNCETAGDFICDTPADYNNGIGWSNCNFTLNVLDPIGNPIDPDETLVMGYFLNCPDDEYYFSDQQASIMNLDLNSNSRNYLRNAPTPTYVEITQEPTLVYPINGETTPGYNSIQVEWEGVPGATRYYLEVSRLPTFSIEPIRQLVYGTSKVLPELEVDKTYYWRVRPFNQHYTCASASSNGSFRTGTLVNTSTITEISKVSLSPNPTATNQQVQLQVQSTSPFRGTVQITDLAGRQVGGTDQYDFPAGEQTINLNISNLSAGIYLVNIQTTTGRLTEKLVITQ